MKLDTEEDLGCPDRVSELVAHIRERPEWTEPYIAFLLWGELPLQEVVARQIQRRAKAYVVIDSELYKRSPTGVFQRCVSLEEGQKILKEIHSGDCGHHASTRSLVAKAFRHGFFWSTTLVDAEYIVQGVMDVKGMQGKLMCQLKNSEQYP